MIRIYGIHASNYYNAAKVAMLEKAIDFEEINQPPGGEGDILKASPMGKIPYIETDQGYLSEVNVIYDYLEDIKPQPRLYPEDPYARAKTKEIIRTAELYVDAPARPLLAFVVFGQPVNQAVCEQARPVIDKGLNAFVQLARFAPYASGPDFTFADISAFFHLMFLNLHTQSIYDLDIGQSNPQIREYMDRVAERPSIQSVVPVMENAMKDLIRSMKG